MKRLLIIPLLLLSLTLGATKYYVSPSPTGNNGNDGSISSPWATLSFACTQAIVPGDTIYVNAGTITETQQVVKALGVSIVGQGDTSIINSTYAGGYTGSINCASAIGNPVDDNSSISYIKLTGSNYTGRIGIYGAYRNNIEIHHCTIEDFSHGAIKFESNNPSAFSPPTVDYATGLSIHDCTINDCGYNVSSYASVWFDGTDGMEVYNNTFTDTARAAGLNSWATIKCNFNVRYDIHDNNFYRLDHEDSRSNFFMENWNYRGDCQFRDNTLYGLATIDFGGPFSEIIAGCSYGVKIYGNSFINDSNGTYTTDGGTQTICAIVIEGNHEKIYVYRNLIQRFGWAIEISTPSAPWLSYWEDDWVIKDIYVYYNLITDVGYSDHTYCYGILYINETNDAPYTTIATNFNFFNNVITAIAGSTYQGIRLNANGTLTGLNIQNNIVKGFDDYGVYLGEHSTDGFDITNVDVTYNCMNDNGTNTVYVESAAGRITISDSDVATGNITTAPAFKSTATYRLTPSSPCVDAGIDVNIDYDYYGHRVPQNGTPDIGACEVGNYVLFYNGKQLY